jgi:iduronate 2-sulfatase
MCSFMSGRLPDTSQMWTFQNSFRNEANWSFLYQPDRAKWTSLPQHFKQAGWWAAGAGKLYHPGSPRNEDNPLSWSIDFPQDEGGGCACSPMVNYCELPENTTCYDVQLTDIVIEQLHEHKRNRTLSAKPFFLGLGEHKPHLPWAAPKSFFDLYPPASELPIAAHPHVPQDLPPIAWHQCTWGAFPFWFTKGAPVNKSVAQHARRAYYACTSFADHNVGRVLDTLDELGYTESTIVMLVGDRESLLSPLTFSQRGPSQL